MKQLNSALIFLFVSGLLGGCAGLHVVPPDNYSLDDSQQVIRVFFDQWGDIYPQSPPFTIPDQSEVGTNVEYGVRTIFQEHYPKKYDLDKEADLVVEKIRELQSKDPDRKLVFLIHGYNYDLSKSEESYGLLRRNISESDADAEHIFIQVYWDGLYEGLFTLLAAAYWEKALTYSNRAGQVGLRKIFHRLSDEDVSVITFSRGAAVALSSIIDPLYDDPKIGRRPFEPLDLSKMPRLKMALIAPAVGSGHFIKAGDGHLEKVGKKFKESGIKICVGFNPDDPQLNKYLKPYGAKFGGDTRLGVDDGYYRKVAKELNTAGKVLQRVEYKGLLSHPLPGYVGKTEATNCLLAGLGLTDKDPGNCGCNFK